MAANFEHEFLDVDITTGTPETALDKYVKAASGIEQLEKLEMECFEEKQSFVSLERMMRRLRTEDRYVHGQLALVEQRNLLYEASREGRRERARDRVRLQLDRMKADNVVKESGEFEVLINRPAELFNSIDTLIQELTPAAVKLSSNL